MPLIIVNKFVTENFKMLRQSKFTNTKTCKVVSITNHCQYFFVTVYAQHFFSYFHKTPLVCRS